MRTQFCQRANVVAEVQFAGGAHAAEHAFAGCGGDVIRCKRRAGTMDESAQILGGMRGIMQGKSILPRSAIYDA